MRDFLEKNERMALMVASDINNLLAWNMFSLKNTTVLYLIELINSTECCGPFVNLYYVRHLGNHGRWAIFPHIVRYYINFIFGPVHSSLPSVYTVIFYLSFSHMGTYTWDQYTDIYLH